MLVGLDVGEEHAPLVGTFSQQIKSPHGASDITLRKEGGLCCVCMPQHRFIARAVAHELEREGVRALLDDLEDQLGQPSKADLARARKAWPKR